MKVTQSLNRTVYSNFLFFLVLCRIFAIYKSLIHFTKLENTSKLNSNGDTHSNKSEPPAEIDINELLKNGGPRFLQMELYKDFKPPVVLIDDKWYIDNMLASAAYSKSKSRRNFAAHLAKLVY